MANPGIWTVLAVATAVYASVAMLLNRVVPEPYMDEIFHIPQAQQYCRGDFVTWDPMITTLPGLYYVAVGYASVLLPLARAAGLDWTLPSLCSVPILRSTNLVLALVCLVLFWKIAHELQPSEAANPSAWMKAALLGLYPLHFFFTFLFYTDVGSTTAVMAMYLAGLRRRHLACALFAAISIYFRQTNAVWALFTLCEGTMDLLNPRPIGAEHHVRATVGQSEKIPSGSRESGQPPEAEGEGQVVSSNGKAGTRLRKRTTGGGAPEGGSGEGWGGGLEVGLERDDRGRLRLVGGGGSEEEEAEEGRSLLTERQVASSEGRKEDDPEGVLLGLWHLARAAWQDRWRVLSHMGPLIAVCAAFAIFVVTNGGIVVGARDAHRMAPHFAQPLYFSAAAAGALGPLHFTPRRASALLRQLAGGFRAAPGRTAVATALVVAAAAVAVHKYSLAHPYLLADNRHYTFYVWKNVIRRHAAMRYLLVPLYLYSGLSILATLKERRPPLWIFFFCMATAGVLVPAPLVELRYFSIPFFLLLLHSPLEKGYGAWLTLVAYALVNAATMYMFLFRTFEWPHETGLQRFMW